MSVDLTKFRRGPGLTLTDEPGVPTEVALGRNGTDAARCLVGTEDASTAFVAGKVGLAGAPLGDDGSRTTASFSPFSATVDAPSFWLTISAGTASPATMGGPRRGSLAAGVPDRALLGEASDSGMASLLRLTDEDGVSGEGWQGSSGTSTPSTFLRIGTIATGSEATGSAASSVSVEGDEALKVAGGASDEDPTAASATADAGASETMGGAADEEEDEPDVGD